MGRKTCPTHADQTAFPNGMQEIFFAGNDWRLYGIRNRLQSVCFNFHAFASSAIAHSEIRNRLDRSGHTTVNWSSHKGIGVTDFLSDTDTVPYLDQRSVFYFRKNTEKLCKNIVCPFFTRLFSSTLCFSVLFFRIFHILCRLK